jgi:hypothetical protein
MPEISTGHQQYIYGKEEFFMEIYNSRALDVQKAIDLLEKAKTS